MWPERFGHAEIARIKAELGPYMASGRLQQSPMPAKGGIFQREWWQLYEDPESLSVKPMHCTELPQLHAGQA
jgi:hypothetical protein